MAVETSVSQTHSNNFAIDGEKSEPMSDDSETGHHRDELGAILFADGGET